MLSLVLPQVSDEVAVWAYRQAFLDQGDSIDGSNGLAQATNYETWLLSCQANQEPETVPPHLVPAHTYLVKDGSGHLVGMVDLRHKLNDYLYQFGGHIGYSVAPDYRGKGFAKAILTLALEKARGLSLSKVLVTCDKNNIASARTIVANGGQLENDVYDPNDKTITQRYWIVL